MCKVSHCRNNSTYIIYTHTVGPYTLFGILYYVILIPPSHRRRGDTAVLVRHKPQWHRHDRRGSAVVPSLIVVAPRKTVKTSDLRGSTAETLNMFKTSAVPRGLGQSAVGSPRHRHDRRRTAMTAVAPYKNRSSTSITAVPPQYNRRAIAKK